MAGEITDIGSSVSHLQCFPTFIRDTLLSAFSVKALSCIRAWGSGRAAAKAGADNDPWHRYQSRVLSALEAVARKHGRGFSLADVATAFHLSDNSRHCFCSSPALPYLDNTSHTTSANSDDGRRSLALGGERSDMYSSSAGAIGAKSGGNEGDRVPNRASALLVPVRVHAGGTLALKSEAELEVRSAGRRGAELASFLDSEDIRIVSEAVEQGMVMRDTPPGKFCWEDEEEDEDEERDEGWGGADYRGPILFM